MNNLEIFKFDLENIKSNLPKNIYALKVLNVDKNETFNIAIEHNGYCPKLYDNHDESNFGEYLSNLEYQLVEDYFKMKKIKKPKQWYHLCEIMTNENGELYHYAKTAN
jgi:hypothetical protein